MYTIEFQKRGLPHAQILLWLSDSNKLENAKHIDEVISAELPHPDLYPKLSKVVKTYMIHGLCGAARFTQLTLFTLIFLSLRAVPIESKPNLFLLSKLPFKCDFKVV